MLIYNCPVGLEIDYIVINYGIIMSMLYSYGVESALVMIEDFDMLDEVASVYPELAKLLANPAVNLR